MGCSVSAASIQQGEKDLAQPVLVQACDSAAQDEGSRFASEVPLSQLGIHVPSLPGDIALCGWVCEDTLRDVAPRFKSWLNLNGHDDPNFCEEELIRCGVENIEACRFAGPEMLPSEQEVVAALRALDDLPRPLMVQCTLGVRSGALLLLWLVEKRGYSAQAAMQLASDDGLEFWKRWTTYSPLRDWLLARLHACDEVIAQKWADGLIFIQQFDPKTSTFTYLLGCEATKEAVLIDPVLEHKQRDLLCIADFGLVLQYVVNTHIHSDHVTSGGRIRSEQAQVRTVISKTSGGKADVIVEDGAKVVFGRFALQALSTPGHTDGCTSWLLAMPGSASLVFTGDALLVRGCGRTDLQQGDPGKLYDSVHSKLLSLPGDTVVYPGHDYKGRNMTSIEEERHFNPRFTKDRQQFIKLMSELELPHPARLDSTVQSNLLDGIQDEWESGGFTM